MAESGEGQTAKGERVPARRAGNVDLPRLYFIHALTPLHAGVGEGLGAINLPTAREQATGYPFLPGSSVKGVLRECAEIRWSGAMDERVMVAFGPPTEIAAEARGGLALTDASLLCLPVRSLFGTFAWVTCPMVLRRVARDAREAGAEAPSVAFQGAGAAPGDGATKGGWIPRGSALHEAVRNLPPPVSATLAVEELMVRVLVDDADGGGEGAGAASAWMKWLANRLWPGDGEEAKAERAFFAARFVVVQDDIFAFMTRLCLEVRHRVSIDDTRGTARESGPWTEEHMPAETLLHGLAIGRSTVYARPDPNGDREESPERASAPERRKKEKVLKTPGDAMRILEDLVRSRPVLRFGGHASVGLGRARISLDVHGSGLPRGGPPAGAASPAETGGAP